MSNEFFTPLNPLNLSEIYGNRWCVYVGRGVWWKLWKTQNGRKKFENEILISSFSSASISYIFSLEREWVSERNQ